MSVIAGAQGPKVFTYNPGDVAKNKGFWETDGDATINFIYSNNGPGLEFGTDGTDNDCVTAICGGEVVPVQTTASEYGFSAVLQLTEANTDDSNWFIGFSDIDDNTFFGDTGALASMDAVGFYKVENSLFFRTCALNAATQSGETLTTAFASATEYALRVEAKVFAGGATIKFYVDETLVDTVTGFSATAMTAMHPIMAVANGGANAETLILKSFVPYAVAHAA